MKAYAKVNLCLYVGHPRPDGYHPLVSVFQSVSLADEVRLEAGGAADEVVCDGVTGPNLALAAVELYRRESGWDGPPVRLVIEKRIPVAAGLGGGSADAAAALLLAAEAAGRPDDPLLAELAPRLGADVPFQLARGRALVTGIGERLEPLPPGPEAAFVLLASQLALSTPAVYREADRLGLTRDLATADVARPVNDLQDAARSLCPEIDDRLAALGPGAMVAGSGPTVFRAFDDPDEAAALAERVSGAILTTPVPPRRSS